MTVVSEATVMEHVPLATEEHPVQELKVLLDPVAIEGAESMMAVPAFVLTVKGVVPCFMTLLPPTV